MRLIISGRDGIIADVPDYDGPIPRTGEYIFRPARDGGASTNVMLVKTVTYGILMRGRATRGGGEGFYAAREQYVEVTV